MPHLPFDGPSGLSVARRARRIDFAAGLGFLADRLDRRKGAVFASGVEDPDRYSRWEFGFVDPPLEIVGAIDRLRLNALTPRGVALLDMIGPILARDPAVGADRREERSVELTIVSADGIFPEEARSRQPSLFAPVRRLLGLLEGLPDAWLGLYGAFGYDLIYQFDPAPQMKSRPLGGRELHLFLPDRVHVLDRRLETAYRYDYDFSLGGRTTQGLGRRPFAPSTRAAAPGGGTGEIDVDQPDAAFARGVDKIRRRLERGDAFEVVLSRTFSAATDAPPSALFRAMRAVNPSPYEFLIQMGEDALVGASPEMFVRVEGDRVESCPIAGTVRRGADPMEDEARIRALLNSAKDEAELTMCTDVDRNDKARICVPGSVTLRSRRLIERYAGLFHTVDHVEGRLRAGLDGVDAFLSHMWAVTLTGAPKRSAVAMIEAMEATPREWYGGAVGGLLFNGGVNTGITIRTVQVKDAVARYRSGASIVYDSVGLDEAAETETKATAFRRLLDRVAAPTADPRPTPAAAEDLPGAGRRIVMIDYEDSFVHTLGDYLRQTGATVETYRCGLAVPDILALGPDLVVHSPGPGRPADFALPQAVRALAEAGVPQFGVCLGLQGIVEAFGGRLALLPRPRHGVRWMVDHAGTGLFEGLPSPLAAGAYHSIHAPLDDLPDALLATALSEDGVVMAVAHRRLPVAAVQFHPESILSLAGGGGRRLVGNAVRSLAGARGARITVRTVAQSGPATGSPPRP